MKRGIKKGNLYVWDGANFNQITTNGGSTTITTDTDTNLTGFLKGNGSKVSSDTIPAPELFLLLAQITGYVMLDWQSFTGLTAGKSGSGTAPVASLGQISMSTGATANSTAYIYPTSALYHSIFKYSMRGWIQTGTVYDLWVGMVTNPTAPTTTENHVAFRVINGTIWCSTGNGSNNTLTSTSVTYTGQILSFVSNGTTASFYIDGVFKLSIDTTMMSPNSVYPVIFVKNTNSSSNVLFYSLGMLYKVG